MISDTAARDAYLRRLDRRANDHLRRRHILDGACHSVWLHGDWRWLTRQMTTEEKEAFADAVERFSAALEPGEPGAVMDRWWRDA